jgi:hypothetical protein
VTCSALDASTTLSVRAAPTSQSRPDDPTGDACLDANRFAALVDGARDVTAERHLDDCAACSELYAEVARLVTPGVTARSWRGDPIALWLRVIAALDRVHGALSPDSVIVGDDGAIVLTARAAIGPYTAPELLRGGAPTHASDQFAVCASLWELLLGTPPFRGATPGALAVAMLRPPEAASRLYRVLVRGLAADPAARWPSLAALAAQLVRHGNPVSV